MERATGIEPHLQLGKLKAINTKTVDGSCAIAGETQTKNTNVTRTSDV
jgi:hypothetical protein